ncbi:MAG TPA: DUF89 family protein [Firmicutes bacterium]|nr:DUF89 family protein [Bacillota bacterium]
MRTKPECITCIMDDVIGAAKTVPLDDTSMFQLIRETLSTLSTSYGPNMFPSYYITRAHRILKRMANKSVLFEEQRAAANEAGMRVRERLRERAKGLGDADRLLLLARWAIAGNSLDFRTVGTGYDLSLDAIEATLDSYASKPLVRDDLEGILAAIRSSRRILYVLDNVGEIALDCLLIEEIRNQSPHAPHVTAVVKSGAITSDAIYEDALRVGLPGVASNVIASGGDTLGISYEEMSDELREELARADLIISKGQANFYVLSEPIDIIHAQIACLFTTKCLHAAKAAGMEVLGPSAVLLGT